MSGRATPPRSPSGALAAALLREHGESLPEIASERFAAAFDRYADARVVLIGESTHGTSDFYRARADITRRLIEHHGFDIVAIEADWPDAAALDRFARHRDDSAAAAAFSRFPAWMWHNEEVEEFVAWLRAFNAAREPVARVELRGLDVYSLRGSIAAVLGYLDHVDADAARAARERYRCLEPWQHDPVAYGRNAILARCEDAVVAQLGEMLQRRLQSEIRDGEALFDAEQNARIVHAAERYYRAMYSSSAGSWNLRDGHMFETLQHVMARRGPRAKAVVWAHNSHVGDAGATVHGWHGQISLGGLCRRHWGSEAVLIGQSTDRGSVVAADEWDGAPQIMTVLPARPDSWEALFLAVGHDAALTDWRGDGHDALREALSQTRLQRAIGVVYRPQSERTSHYYEAVLGEQFDAWLWFAHTRALQPLPAAMQGADDPTVPSGD